MSTMFVSLGDTMSEILSSERGRATSRALNAPCWEALAKQLYGDIDWRRRHVRSAKNVADAASRFADAGLLSPVSVFTQGFQAIGRGWRTYWTWAFLWRPPGEMCLIFIPNEC